jgi:beta-catenin-like protein 1
MPRENQLKFMAAEGFELLLRCLKEQEYAAGCTINALSYAVMKNQACCERFVDVGGLKYVFPLLVGKGFKKSLKKKASGEKRNVEEVALSIVAQLCSSLANCRKNDYSSRLLNKFLENEREKLERCVELYVVYVKQLAHTDASIESTRSALLDSEDVEALEEFDEEENILSQVSWA